MTAFVSYATAITVRDAVYWPIVAQVYSELHKVEKRNVYKLQQTMTMLHAMKILRDQDLHVKASGGVQGYGRTTSSFDNPSLKQVLNLML